MTPEIISSKVAYIEKRPQPNFKINNHLGKLKYNATTVEVSHYLSHSFLANQRAKVRKRGQKFRQSRYTYIFFTRYNAEACTADQIA